MSAPSTGTRRVVVGVDGSEPSQRALEWAAIEARMRAVPMLIVTAWLLPASPYPIDLDAGSYGQAAEALLERSLLDVRSLADGALEVELRAVHDDARSALMDVVTVDDLLVVGSRGGGSIAGLLLGSVASYCVRHAPCPVLVVPASDRA